MAAMASGAGARGQAQAPAYAPAAEYGSTLPRMVDDERGYMAHGEIMLLLVVVVFVLLFTSTFLCLCLRRRRDRRRDGTSAKGSSTVMRPDLKG